MLYFGFAQRLYQSSPVSLDRRVFFSSNYISNIVKQIAIIITKIIWEDKMKALISYIRQSIKKTNGVFRPIIVTDIDGVLLRGKTQIPGTLQALHTLNQQKIPLACLTNGGGQLQLKKTQKMNAIFGQKLFDHELMFMNHSPVRSHLLQYSKLPGIILISGTVNIISIVQDLKIDNYITADELYAIFHQAEPSVRPDHDFSFYKRTYNIEEIVQKVCKRLKMKDLPGNIHLWGELINSIFALNDVSPYQTTLQVIHNVFSERKRRNLANPPYFASQNDIVWAGEYHRPRLAFGPFNYMLEEHCERHSFTLNKFYFGKPQKVAFEFVGQKMMQRYGQGCFFMIGDNPRADICGANRIGWPSFLTKTGVHQGNENDPQNPASMVVQNFKQAIDTIIKIKNEKSYL